MISSTFVLAGCSSGQSTSPINETVAKGSPEGPTAEQDGRITNNSTDRIVMPTNMAIPQYFVSTYSSTDFIGPNSGAVDQEDYFMSGLTSVSDGSGSTNRNFAFPRELQVTCVTANGGFSCRGTDGYGQTSVPKGLKYVIKAFALPYEICVQDLNELKCWGEGNVSKNLPKKNISESAISEGGFSPILCVISENKVYCANSVIDGKSTQELGSDYVSRIQSYAPKLISPKNLKVSIGGTVCVEDDGSLKCWGRLNINLPLNRLIDYSLVSTRMAGADADSLCVIDAGKLDCYVGLESIGLLEKLDYEEAVFGVLYENKILYKNTYELVRYKPSTNVTVKDLYAPKLENADKLRASGRYICVRSREKQGYCWGIAGDWRRIGSDYFFRDPEQRQEYNQEILKVRTTPFEARCKATSTAHRPFICKNGVEEIYPLLSYKVCFWASGKMDCEAYDSVSKKLPNFVRGQSIQAAKYENGDYWLDEFNIVNFLKTVENSKTQPLDVFDNNASNCILSNGYHFSCFGLVEIYKRSEIYRTKLGTWFFNENSPGRLLNYDEVMFPVLDLKTLGLEPKGDTEVKETPKNRLYFGTPECNQYSSEVDQLAENVQRTYATAFSCFNKSFVGIDCKVFFPCGLEKFRNKYDETMNRLESCGLNGQPTNDYDDFKRRVTNLKSEIEKLGNMYTSTYGARRCN